MRVRFLSVLMLGLLLAAPAVAQIDQVRIGVNGMT